ncbi:addiction module toxin, RelE/StbE family [Bacteroidia bacterium]|nr:addiction module toxin, RelE/StbE family [Bacteroidia bacterium]
MLQPVYTNSFEKNIARCIKRGYDMSVFKIVASILIEDIPLPQQYKPHKLSGNYANHWECHIKPDWLLIYRYNTERTQIIFETTGTHSDIFKK